MFDYDFLDAVEKRYNRIYSYGGEVERSFFQNVGRIINKKAFIEKPDKTIDEVFKNTEEIMSGDYSKRHTKR